MEQATTTPEQHTTAWDKLRATGIGGSEAAAAMGLDPWMSPFALFSIKAGLVEPRRAGKAAEWGKPSGTRERSSTGIAARRVAP